MYLVLSLRHLRVHATFTYNLTMFCILVSSLVPVLSILRYDGHPTSQQLQVLPLLVLYCPDLPWTHIVQ